MLRLTLLFGLLGFVVDIRRDFGDFPAACVVVGLLGLCLTSLCLCLGYLALLVRL